MAPIFAHLAAPITLINPCILAKPPDHGRKITFIAMNRTTHGEGKLSRALCPSHRSALLARKGRVDISALPAETGKAEIKARLDDTQAAP